MTTTITKSTQVSLPTFLFSIFCVHAYILIFSNLFSKSSCHNLWFVPFDVHWLIQGGARDTSTPPVHILSFSCSFQQKNMQNNSTFGSWCIPLRKILDPPLMLILNNSLLYWSNILMNLSPLVKLTTIERIKILYNKLCKIIWVIFSK